MRALVLLGVMRLPLVALLCSVCGLLAQTPAPKKTKPAPAVAEAPGPWILGTIGVGQRPDGTIETTALKGFAVKLGDDGLAAMAYDLELGRPLGAWSGKFTTAMNLMSRGDYPTALGKVLFLTDEVAGYEPGENAAALSVRTGFGPLPVEKVRFKGFHHFGKRVALRWEVAGIPVVETAEALYANEAQLVVRSVEVAPNAQGVTVLLGKAEDAERFLVSGPGKPAMLGTAAVWRVPASDHPSALRITYVPAGAAKPTNIDAEGLAGLLEGARSLWPETVETKGDISTKQGEAYVVDRVRLPETNPWKAPMFTSAFDFLPDGRAVICTFHGDVFVVSGLDAKLEKVTWRRYATGLYHPLGLKVVKGEVYVTCRDGIWKLRDTNGDGECDTYEAFNFDLMVTKSFHEFTFDLQTDPEGNFYLIKAGPVKKGGRGFDEICAHHGSLLKVSPDGKKLEVFATGFRAPNGIAVSPSGQVTTGDNEGTWTPVCRLNWVKQGGFYGVPPLSHRTPEPSDYDRPLCWLPKDVDNSSGGQVWVTSEKFGPWSGRLLHLSYGTCSLYGVLPQSVIYDGHPQMQGGVARFNVNFDSGVMRARFSPVDGQLYVTGLRGWQTTATRNGCFQRVRYTGDIVRMPMELKVTRRGVQVDFSAQLDPAAVADVNNWNAEVWNYVWSAAYGSPDISTLEPKVAAGDVGKDGKPEFSKEQMTQRKHDVLTVKSATLSADRRSVFLEIHDIRPAMQMQLKYDLKTADDQELRGQIVNTIHALAE